MTLPASGNSISLSQVNSELGRSSTQTIDMNDSSLRALFGRTGSGTTISMSDGLGKSNVSVSLSQLQSRSLQEFTAGYGYITLTFNTNGTWSCAGSNTPSIGSGNWASTTSGVGSSYWIRWTRTASTLGGGSSSAGSSGWLRLDAARTITVTHSGLNGGYVDATYTLEIATDSGGSNIVTSCTGTYLYVFNEG